MEGIKRTINNKKEKKRGEKDSRERGREGFDSLDK